MDSPGLGEIIIALLALLGGGGGGFALKNFFQSRGSEDRPMVMRLSEDDREMQKEILSVQKNNGEKLDTLNSDLRNFMMDQATFRGAVDSDLSGIRNAIQTHQHSD